MGPIAVAAQSAFTPNTSTLMGRSALMSTGPGLGTFSAREAMPVRFAYVGARGHLTDGAAG